MLGLVFTEFMEMVETAFPENVYEALLDLAESQFESGGDYTSVGNYQSIEMLGLVGELSKRTEIPVPDLVEAYGKHLFGRFNARYAQFFTGVSHSFEFLSGIESRIHSEVRKLYSEAKLPTFVCELPDSQTLIMHYNSERPLAHLAKGLIAGCIDYFGNDIDCEFIELSGGENKKATFILREAA